MRKSPLITITAASALLVFAGWAAQPATAQSLVPGSTLTAPKSTAPGANARGIKDNGVKGCGNCGLTSGRVKRTDGGRPAGRKAAKFKAGADLDGALR